MPLAVNNMYQLYVSNVICRYFNPLRAIARTRIHNRFLVVVCRLNHTGKHVS